MDGVEDKVSSRNATKSMRERERKDGWCGRKCLPEMNHSIWGQTGRENDGGI